MKKFALIGLLVLLGTGAFAQTSAGNISLGGSIGFSTSSRDELSSENKGTMFSINPSIGYFVKDGLELGLNTQLTFGSYTMKSEGTVSQVKSKNFGYAIGPYLRKYISITEKLHFTAAGGLGYQNSSVKNPDLDKELISTTSGYYITATPGLTYFATPKLGFTATIGNIGYTTTTLTEEQSTPKSEVTSKQFNFDLTPATATLGIRYFINR